MFKGLGSRRGEIGPAIEMHTNLKYVYMVYFIEKNQNCICLVLKLCKLWASKRQGPSVNFAQKVTPFTLQCNAKDVTKFG